jgi:hypothetical protein
MATAMAILPSLNPSHGSKISMIARLMASEPNSLFILGILYCYGHIFTTDSSE